MILKGRDLIVTLMRPKNYLAKVSRIVIKVGTSNLTGPSSSINPNKVKRLVEEVVELRRDGREVFIVTSGAIAAGVGKLALTSRPKQMPSLQAAAAVGQSILMKTYAEYFARHHYVIAQLLLTKEDFADQKRFQNLNNTLEALMGLKFIPIVNENDTVTVDEIRFGDNDNLAALLSAGVKADLLVILSDTDGLYTGDPKVTKDVKPIRTVTAVTPELEKSAGEANRGSGGMVTKLQAAKTTLKAGIPLAILDGEAPNILKKLLAGEDVGTMFVSKELIMA